MAGHQAIAATTDAVMRLLQRSHDPADFDGAPLEFRVFGPEDFQNPIREGVSLFLYRIWSHDVRRMPRSPLIEGRPQRPGLPLELHFLLTAWARTAARQQEIAGWVMQAINAEPVLTADHLNAYRPGVFHDGEGAELGLADSSMEEVLRAWEVGTQRPYQLSLAYVARGVEIR